MFVRTNGRITDLSGAGIKVLLFLIVLIVAVPVFLAEMLVGPSHEARCKDANPDAVILQAYDVKDTILCKIIDADSVERSVWLDPDGVILKAEGRE